MSTSKKYSEDVCSDGAAQLKSTWLFRLHLVKTQKESDMHQFFYIKYYHISKSSQGIQSHVSDKIPDFNSKSICVRDGIPVWSKGCYNLVWPKGCRKCTLSACWPWPHVRKLRRGHQSGPLSLNSQRSDCLCAYISLHHRWHVAWLTGPKHEKKLPLPMFKLISLQSFLSKLCSLDRFLSSVTSRVNEPICIWAAGVIRNKRCCEPVGDIQIRSINQPCVS